MRETCVIDVLIGQRLRRARQARNLTAAELAATLGVSGQQMVEFEAGQKRLSAAMLFSLCSALEVPVGHFFQEDGLPDRPGGHS